jgi:serine protease
MDKTMTNFRKLNVVKIALLTILILAIATPAFGSSSTVRVWVEYRDGKSSLVHSALKGAGAQFHYQFDRLNSYVVTVDKTALTGLSLNPNISGIEVDEERYLVEPTRVTLEDIPDPNNLGQTIPYGIDAVQARDVWDANLDGAIDEGAPTGAGRTVCIIDTGYYNEHEDLIDVELLGGMSQVDENFTEDGYGHGTHVAGTVTAMNNNLGVVGVTPGTVSLYIVKIFGNDGLWVRFASDLVAGIYTCADNGANIVSMSLAGNGRQAKEMAAFDDLYKQGILFVAAASNESKPTPMYPASYDSVISVAAVDINNVVADFSNYNKYVELSAPGVDVLSTLSYVDDTTLTVDGDVYSGNHIEFTARGDVTGTLADGGRCTTTGDWTDRIVLCERGDISFYDKVMNVQNSGGAAAVIYNNEPGNFLGTMVTPGEYILAISLSQEDGQYLVANKLGLEGTVSSHFYWPDSGYAAWGGTSMATPHVSGVAALIWSAYPNLTNVQIREAMDATALDLGDPGRDKHYGFGLVQAFDALQYLATIGPGQGPKGPNK